MSTNRPRKHLLIDATGINFIDVAGAEMLAQEAKRRRRLGGALYLYRVNEEVLRILTSSGRIDLHRQREHLRGQLEGGRIHLCEARSPKSARACEKRIFRECKASLPHGQQRKSVHPA